MKPVQVQSVRIMEADNGSSTRKLNMPINYNLRLEQFQCLGALMALCGSTNNNRILSKLLLHLYLFSTGNL